MTREEGVWSSTSHKLLEGDVHFVDSITGDQQAKYESINMIREYPFSMQSKTLDPNSKESHSIHTRRLVDIVQRNVQSLLAAALFESNTSSLRIAIITYLFLIWKQGALVGYSSEQSYFFQIGKGVTPTFKEVDQDIMQVKVGIAAIQPEVFITFTVSQQQHSG
jgi:phage tail sheath protein FI